MTLISRTLFVSLMWLALGPTAHAASLEGLAKTLWYTLPAGPDGTEMAPLKKEFRAKEKDGPVVNIQYAKPYPDTVNIAIHDNRRAAEDAISSFDSLHDGKPDLFERYKHVTVAGKYQAVIAVTSNTLGPRAMSIRVTDAKGKPRFFIHMDAPAHRDLNQDMEDDWMKRVADGLPYEQLLAQK